MTDAEKTAKAVEDLKAKAEAEATAKAAAEKKAKQKKIARWTYFIKTVYGLMSLVFITMTVSGLDTLVSSSSDEKFSLWGLSTFSLIVLFILTGIGALISLAGVKTVKSGKQAIIMLWDRARSKQDAGFVWAPWPLKIEEVDKTLKTHNVPDTLIETPINKSNPTDDIEKDRPSLIQMLIKEVSITWQLNIDGLTDLNDYFVAFMDLKSILETFKDFTQSALRVRCRDMGMAAIMTDPSSIIEGTPELTVKEEGKKDIVIPAVKGVRKMLEERLEAGKFPLRIVAIVINEPPQPADPKIAASLREKSDIQLMMDRDLKEQARKLAVAEASNLVAEANAKKIKMELDQKKLAYPDMSHKEITVMEAELAALTKVAESSAPKYVLGTGNLMDAVKGLIPKSK